MVRCTREGPEFLSPIRSKFLRVEGSRVSVLKRSHNRLAPSIPQLDTAVVEDLFFQPCTSDDLFRCIYIGSGFLERRLNIGIQLFDLCTGQSSEPLPISLLRYSSKVLDVNL